MDKSNAKAFTITGHLDDSLIACLLGDG